LGELGVSLSNSKLRLIDPLGYLDFVALMSTAALVVTDSGGVQEETTFLGIPCLTVRENTERPITLTVGTNRLVGNRTEELLKAIDLSLRAQAAPRGKPDLWDGQTSRRIARFMSQLRT
jgi:UDP-N-acetylglucosamine 2-epimerase (non-hydrolysing)